MKAEINLLALRNTIWCRDRHSRKRERVRNLIVSYSETLLPQIQQTVACNAMHTTECAVAN